MRRRRLALAGLVLGALPACSSHHDGPAAAPDFALLDVNPASATYDSMVSPRHHVGHVTAWYFGSAT